MRELIAVHAAQLEFVNLETQAELSAFVPLLGGALALHTLRLRCTIRDKKYDAELLALLTACPHSLSSI